MNPSIIPVLCFGSLLALTSCYVWQPPVHQPPIGPSRYMAMDQGRLPPPPGPPGPMMESPYSEPSGPAYSNDPAAIVGPNPNVTVPPTPSGPSGGSNATVGTPTPSPPTSPPPATTPYGVKVPGKTGFVYSPFDKTAGVVDVQGMAPGTKVKCPYTGKVFIVP